MSRVSQKLSLLRCAKDHDQERLNTAILGFLHSFPSRDAGRLVFELEEGPPERWYIELSGEEAVVEKYVGILLAYQDGFKDGFNLGGLDT